MSQIVSAITDLGCFAGLAALLAVVWPIRNVAAQMKPNHGSSLRDAVDRIEKNLDNLNDRYDDLNSRLGHETGEIKAAALQAHDDLAARIRHLEAKN